jgi:hypothetical protein
LRKDPQLAIEVKAILDLIKKISPGKSVELRIPPYGAIQCVAGINHTRGIPPHTVEMSGEILIKLCSQPDKWAELHSDGQILASGVCSDLSQLFNEISRYHPVGK